MRKDLIKCDICGRELKHDTDNHFFVIKYCDVPGWATLRADIFGDTKEVCGNCISGKIAKLF